MAATCGDGNGELSLYSFCSEHCRSDWEDSRSDRAGEPLTWTSEASSERSLHHEALKESRARYRTLVEDVFETSDVGTYVLDGDFEVVWTNAAAEEYFGIDRAEAVGRDHRELVQSRIKDQCAQPDRFERRVLRAYEDNTGVEQFECRLLPKGNRKNRWLEHWSRPISHGWYEGGRVEHYTDVTDAKTRERQLRVLARVLRHSVRNKMNVVTGRAEVIAGETEGRTAEQAAVILATASELMELTEKQRCIVELVSDATERQPVDVSNAVEVTVERLDADYPEAEITVEVPDRVFGLAVPEIDEAVYELAKNAVVHSKRSAPAVEIEVVQASDWLEVRVRDDNPTVTDVEELIFRGEREITQLDHSRGLGLWLVHWLVVTSGGMTTVKKRDSGGNCFGFTLPNCDGIAKRPCE